MRRFILAAAVAGAVLGVAGCGGAGSAAVSAASSSHTTSSPATITTPTATATATATTTYSPPPFLPVTSSPDIPVVAPPAVTSSSGGCALPRTGDLILWEKWPGTDAEVSMLGDVNIIECRYSWDTLAETEPSGPGYCDILARPSDNPGYDMNEVPPARPTHILAQAGEGC